ncbi:transmembrane protein 187 [Emydura macquarii macquarii]|uniref:transmembrane protein 187 n=1 Tax=Emydura macquarii macquarii TaxID=1129001 RepID=UPI00352BB25B
MAGAAGSRQPRGGVGEGRAVPCRAMRSEERAALRHVAGAAALCLALLGAGALDGAGVAVGYGLYAEPAVGWLPPALAMPCNALVNLGYAALGWRWFPPAGPGPGPGPDPGRYLQAVFALLALAYGPVQWARLWSQHPRAAVLDQWVTLPIFAWAGLWCHALARGWRPAHAALATAASLLSYGLALAHPHGFELALAAHVAAVAAAAWQAQRRRGDAVSAWIAVAGFTACLGFVLLKLGDVWLAQWAPFQRLTGHFWSKVCDVLQFHCAFLFATRLGKRRPAP